MTEELPAILSPPPHETIEEHGYNVESRHNDIINAVTNGTIIITQRLIMVQTRDHCYYCTQQEYIQPAKCIAEVAKDAEIEIRERGLGGVNLITFCTKCH